MAGDIKILDNISINQNLIMAIAFYAGAYWALPIDGVTLQEEMQIGGIMRLVLYGICVIGLLFAMISLLSSLIAYSIEYYRKKIYKGKQYKLEYYKAVKNNGDNKRTLKDIHDIDINIKGTVY